MRFGFIGLWLAFCLSLTGCDQLRESVADLLQPPSSQEMALRVGKLAGEGKVDQAIKAGEAFLSERPDPSGNLHRRLAELYTNRGDTINAVRHLQKSLGGGEPQADQSAKPAAPAPAAAQDPGVAAGTDTSSARVRPDGTLEVRAGTATATIGK